MKTYNRRQLNEAEIQQVRTITTLIERMPESERLAAIATLITENALLAEEVNNHRRSLGYKPLPVFQFNSKS